MNIFEHQNRYRYPEACFGACTICGEKAAHKVEEDLQQGPGGPLDHVHPLTAELCTPCFQRVFMNYDGKRAPPGLAASAAVPAAEVAGYLNDGTPVYFGREP